MPSAATLSWPWTAMVEFYRFKFRCVEGNRVLYSCLLDQILFFNEQEFSLGIDESLNQPGAGHAVNFDVFPRNPFHIHLTVATNT